MSGGLNMALFPSEIRSTKHEIRNNFKTEKRKTRNGGGRRAAVFVIAALEL
jgi:hypothetical protein